MKFRLFFFIFVCDWKWIYRFVLTSVLKHHLLIVIFAWPHFDCISEKQLCWRQCLSIAINMQNNFLLSQDQLLSNGGRSLFSMLGQTKLINWLRNKFSYSISKKFKRRRKKHNSCKSFRKDASDGLCEWINTIDRQRWLWHFFLFLL